MNLTVWNREIAVFRVTIGSLTPEIRRETALQCIYDMPKTAFQLYPNSPIHRLRSGYRLFQRPSRKKQIPSSHLVDQALLAAAPSGTKARFYRTTAGAEMDLVLELGAKHGVWAIEIKRSAGPGLQKGNHHALADIAPRRSFYVHGGSDRFPMTATTEAIGLHEPASELAALV